MPYGSNSPSQNIQSLGAGGLYGPYAQGGSGGMPVARDQIDARRMAIGRTPEAEYPDGYLGTIRSRRDDRGRPTDTVLDSLKNRLSQRSYQRGVHKGERVDPSDYFWPKEMSPDRGLIFQSKGMKTPLITNVATNTHLVNDGKVDTQSFVPAQMSSMSLRMQSRLRPSWS